MHVVFQNLFRKLMERQILPIRMTLVEILGANSHGGLDGGRRLLLYSKEMLLCFLYFA